VFLALFVTPVVAVNSEMPPLPSDDGAVATVSANAQIGQVTPLARPNAVVASRAQAIKDRIINAVNVRANANVTVAAVHAQIAERARTAAAVRAQDVRQTETFLLQAAALVKSLNATQRQQLATVVYGFVNSSLDNRVQVAEKLGDRGLDPAKVDAYSASVDAIKAQIAAANSTAERRKLVVEANREWAAFKRDVVKSAAWARIRNATDKAQAALDRMNALIAKLAQNGTNTTLLENIAGRVQNRINAARQQNITLRQAEWRLAFARDGLSHLAAQIKRVVKAQQAEEMPEQAEPAELAVEDAAEAAPEAVSATPSPAAEANATATQ
jgi:hypothetical protein